MIAIKYPHISSAKLIYYSLTTILFLLIALPFIAPLLSHYGYKKPANVIYKIYSFMCHQKAHRSLFIYDEQCAWCARDTFIWTTIFFAWVYVLKGKPMEGLSWKVALGFAAPMILDGTIQLIATVISIYSYQALFYESTNTIRSITGVLFGIGVSMFFFPRLKAELEPSYR